MKYFTKKLAHVLNRARTHAGAHKEIKGIEQLDKIIDINQSPIGRTPRSNPATYTNVFGDIRKSLHLQMRQKCVVINQDVLALT